jgi:hypothetical protein
MPIKVEECNSNVAVGVVTEGPFGIADMLCISWDTPEECRENWGLLKLCNQWRIRAQYDAADTVRLTLQAQGEPIPAGPLTVWRGYAAQAHLVPTYHAVWTLPDSADGVRFFIRGVRRRGFFVLLPAVQQQIASLRPIVAFI